jgi:hypothetical protein
MKVRGLLPTTADPRQFNSALLKEAVASQAQNHPATIASRKRRQK